MHRDGHQDQFRLRIFCFSPLYNQKLVYLVSETISAIGIRKPRTLRGKVSHFASLMGFVDSGVFRTSCKLSLQQRQQDSRSFRISSPVSICGPDESAAECALFR